MRDSSVATSSDDSFKLEPSSAEAELFRVLRGDLREDGLVFVVGGLARVGDFGRALGPAEDRGDRAFLLGLLFREGDIGSWAST
mmetsp:Transcript_36388/g.46906  ORF Transcript_36388/g.46906 Transcript_36388/m.46906 type:complete len:84 (+) Transcript_36388:284-535(+)